MVREAPATGKGHRGGVEVRRGVWLFAPVKIRRLDITGFKSFAEHTVFSFDDGVTGIVGPNGCGKSNVVDAIRWVMGEQSPKQLRGRSMEDVIFNGSESRPATGIAEVSLTFANDGRGIPAQYAGFSEITVTRRLYRNGDSDYAINKTPCRLLDITELFLGTGVGARAYSIIEQGRIGMIVSAKAEDRRAVIEEAAGVTKYKARRKAAERKLDATEQNLLRISDVVGELAKRLDSLRRQAKKAERYKQLRAEQRGLELLVSVKRHVGLSDEARALRDESDKLLEAAKDAQATVASLEGGLAAERLHLLEDERHLNELTERAHAVDKQLKLDEQNLVFYARERESLRARVEQHKQEQDLLRSRRALLDREQEQLDADQQHLAAAAGEEQGRLSDAEAELRRTQSEVSASLSEVERERAAVVGVITRLANHRTHLVALERRRTDLAQRLDKASGESAQLEARAKELANQEEALAALLTETKARRAELEVRRDESEAALARARAEQQDNQTALQKLREDLATSRSRLTSLLEIQKSMEGYGQGVRHLMTGERREGIVALVADVVRADRDYEQAIEAVLGERLQWIVVESQQKGVEAVDYLKTAAQGRASFVPLQLALPSLPEPPPHNGVAALGVVHYEERYADVVRVLLGDVFVVDTMADALALWAANPFVWTLVTKSGEVMSSQGVIGGGSLQGVSIGLLGKRREIQELAEETRDFEARFALAKERGNDLAGKLAASEALVKQLERDARDTEIQLARQERDHAQAGSEHRAAAERAARLQAEAAQLSRQLDECAREEQASRDEIARSEGEQHERDTRLSALHAQVAQVRSRSENAQASVTKLKVAAAAAAERKEGLSRAVQRVAEQRREVEGRVESLLRAIEDAERRHAELGEKSAAADAEVKKLLADSERLRDEVSALRAAYEAQQARLGTGDTGVRAARKALDQLVSDQNDRSLALRERELALDSLAGQVRDRHGVELFEVAETKADEARDLDDARTESEILELRESIERLGEVNLTAIEEAEEVGKRHDFLAAQKKDLEETIAKLHSAIARIDRAAKARFKETFELVNEKFRQVFPRLFRGGEARLELVDPREMEARGGEEPASPADGGGAEPQSPPFKGGRGGYSIDSYGIEIFAQPPGKKPATVNLLSGGEKALTAVSLIFAIFLIKPTPFCLLDEVDAPLDEANVGRYNEMVREMSKTSQFIIVTHNKRTMEITDALYGVTMEEPGCSKIVSVKLSEQRAGAAA